MESTVSSKRHAPSDADMATLTYEDGLLEIDSFFNSSPSQADTITQAEHREEAHDAGVLVGEQNAPPSAEIESTQHEQDVAPTTEQAGDTDEFATLIEDIDEVTAHEAVIPNPKGQLHFILNDLTSSSPQTTTEGSHGLEEPVVHPQSTVRGTVPSGSSSPQFEKTQTQKQEQPPLDSNDDIHKSPTTKFAPNIPDIAASIASVRSEKGLTLLSPKPVQLTHTNPSYAATDTSQDLLRHISPVTTSLPLPSPDPAAGIKAVMSHVSPTVAKSPALPSSDGKTSLMEEMRGEDDDAQHSPISDDESIPQPVLTTVANTPSSVEQAGPKTMDDSGSAKVVLKEQIPKDADLAQQKAQAIIAANRKKVLPQPEGSDMTDSDDTGSEMEKPQIVAEGKGTKRKATSNAKTRAASSKITDKAMKPRSEGKSQPQLLKSTGNPPVTHHEESDLEEEVEESEPEVKSSPEAAVPAKRKARRSPAQPAKRAKPQARPKTKAAKITDDESTGVGLPKTIKSGGQKSTDAEVKPTMPPPKAGVSRISMGKREMKELMWAHIAPHVTPGPRKTRAQQEEEDKRKEEEEKRLPNAGRAAKERHKRKTA